MAKPTPQRIITLVRHGETDWNKHNRFQGNSDIELNETGLGGARELESVLNHEAWDFVLSSDLARARVTGELAVPEHKARLETTELWREMNFGQWEGLTYKEITAENKLKLSDWGKPDFRPPEGESLHECYERVRDALADLPPEGKIVVFAHGGPIRLALCALMDYPLELYWKFKLDNCSVSEFHEYNGSSILQHWNWRPK